MNEATREFIATMKAKRQAEADAKEAKRKAKEEAKQRIKDYANTHARRTSQRVQECNSTPATNITAAQPSRFFVPLTQEKLSQIGDSIPGSRLVRDFCCICGEAIRVVSIGSAHVCLDCEPTGKPGATSKAIVKNAMEYHGGQFHSAEW
jgi:hypothetical protein